MHGTGGDTVSAHLFPGKYFFVQESNLATELRQAVSGGASAGARPDDNGIIHLAHGVDYSTGILVFPDQTHCRRGEALFALRGEKLAALVVYAASFLLHGKEKSGGFGLVLGI
jgi:hypothetical protein